MLRSVCWGSHHMVITSSSGLNSPPIATLWVRGGMIPRMIARHISAIGIVLMERAMLIGGQPEKVVYGLMGGRAVHGRETQFPPVASPHKRIQMTAPLTVPAKIVTRVSSPRRETILLKTGMGLGIRAFPCSLTLSSWLAPVQQSVHRRDIAVGFLRCYFTALTVLSSGMMRGRIP